MPSSSHATLTYVNGIQGQPVGLWKYASKPCFNQYINLEARNYEQLSHPNLIFCYGITSVDEGK